MLNRDSMHYYMIFENLLNKFPWNIFQGKYGTWQKTRQSTYKLWDIEVNVPLVGHWNQCPTSGSLISFLIQNLRKSQPSLSRIFEFAALRLSVFKSNLRRWLAQEKNRSWEKLIRNKTFSRVTVTDENEQELNKTPNQHVVIMAYVRR